MPLNIKVVGKTDKGLVRSGNEDFLHIDETNHVYGVCDGMGGHQAGEIASMMASETIRTVFENFRKPLLSAVELDLGRTLPPGGELLVKAIRLANRAIYNSALQDNTRSGMGTTVVAAAVESDIMSVAHVGDSRAYRLGETAMEPLTIDHSWIEEFQQTQNISREEAGNLVGKNVITRALGVRENVEVDCRVVKIKPGDIFMFCSDGLCGFADDDEIFDVADRGRKNIQKMADDLVQMANDRGGADNVTIVVFEVIGVQESPLPELEVFTQAAEDETLLNSEDAWLERIKDSQIEEESETARAPGKTGTNKLVLISIVIAFIIIAYLIIHFSQNQ